MPIFIVFDKREGLGISYVEAESCEEAVKEQISVELMARNEEILLADWLYEKVSEWSNMRAVQLHRVTSIKQLLG